MRRTNKDILLGLVGTLTDEECKEIYYIITTVKDSDKKDVVRDLVKLTSEQYNKLVWLWGLDKTEKCISILNEWLKKKDKDITRKISHYKQLITWVETKYYRYNPANDKSIKYNSKIDTAWKARKYISRIPKELRAYDTEVKFLIERFGLEVLS